MNKLYLHISDKLKISYLTFGNDPKVLFMSGMHGNELSGISVLKEIPRKINTQSLAILPVANPEAYKNRTRENPIDNLDLNRLFPVKSVKSHSYKIARQLQEFTQNFDIVIDLHDFANRNTVICGVDLNVASPRIKKEIANLFKIINVEAVCRIDDSHEPQKKGSLTQFLQRKGKMAFGLELPDKKALTNSQKKTIIEGLLKVTRLYSNSKKGENLVTKTKKNLATYLRQNIESESTSNFHPKKGINERIYEGDVIGTLDNTKPVVSPYNGMLLSISLPRKVGKGEKVATIGKKI